MSGAVPDPADSAAEAASLEGLYRQARALLDAGRDEAAAAIYRDILAQAPGEARAENNLGTVLEAQGRRDEAMACYGRAVALDPGAAPIYYNIGHLQQCCGRAEAAVAAYRMAIELRPDYPAAYFNLSHALLDLGRAVEAAAVVDDWLAVSPGAERALHLRAALGGSGVPARASDGFIREVFDRMAADFDAALAALDYRAPQLLAEAVAERLGAAAGLEVLDAGCGTGLAGALLRPYAGRLVGVDLSAAMLAQAAGRGLYDELVTAELGAYLGAAEAAFDLIACADTLVYFGALEPPLGAAARALRPGGWLVFTVEELSAEGVAAGYRLAATGRFSHAAGYLAEAVAAAGLADATISPAVLRREAGAPVPGFVVAARRPAADAAQRGSRT